MNALEMKQEFLTLYDKVTNQAAPGYTNSEISIFLNKAQLQFVKNRYNFKGNAYNEGFEETEKRRKDLAELTRNAELTGGTTNSSSQTGVSPNGEFFDLPDDLLYALREEVLTTSSTACYDALRIRVKPITHDEYAIEVNNPFAKPDKSVVWRLDISRDLTQGANNEKKRHELIAGTGMTVNKYYLRYLRVPTIINVDTNVSSEINDEVHGEIIDYAVRIATGITDPQAYPIKIKEQQGSE